VVPPLLAEAQNTWPRQLFASFQYYVLLVPSFQSNTSFSEAFLFLIKRDVLEDLGEPRDFEDFVELGSPSPTA
jgi:hypothetical protein